MHKPTTTSGRFNADLHDLPEDQIDFVVDRYNDDIAAVVMQEEGAFVLFNDHSMSHLERNLEQQRLSLSTVRIDETVFPVLVDDMKSIPPKAMYGILVASIVKIDARETRH